MDGGGAHGLAAELRESEAKWQNRAARAEEDLKALNARFRALEKESKNSRTKWESERTQLMAEKTAAEADADRHRTAAEAADEDCARAYQAKEEAEARAALEARSESKRAALRRTQAAAAEARRRRILRMPRFDRMSRSPRPFVTIRGLNPLQGG